jgi:DNA modification methylase
VVVVRVMAIAGWVRLWSDWLFSGEPCRRWALDEAAGKIGLRPVTVGVWHREGLGMGWLLRKTYETFAVVLLDGFQRRATDEPDLWTCKWTPGDRQLGHSAQKPVALMRRAIELVTPPGGMVLDPFAGVGSTGVAAHLGGYGFIGIEREAEHVEVARRRIAVPLFAEVAP